MERQEEMRPNRIVVRFLWTTVVFLSFVGLAVGIRRTGLLLRPKVASTARNPAEALDEHFLSQRGLTLTHILPGMLFMILGPLQFMAKLRERHPRFHRWSGRIFLSASTVLGVAGLGMALGPTIGGADEKAAILLFGSFFLAALAKAFWHVLRREFTQHREWMIRGFATGLAVAAIRPIMGSFFAAAALRGRTPDPGSFFGTAFWIGFVLSAVVAEAWIRYTRRRMESDPRRAPVWT
jgi:Predicted membrane protein (DUF2306)